MNLLKPGLKELSIKIMIVICILITLSVTGYHFFIQDMNSSRTSFVNSNLQTAEFTANYLDNFVLEIKNTLIDAAASDAVSQKNPDAIKLLLKDLRLSNPEVSLFFVVDPQGNLVSVAPSSQAPVNVSDRDFFKAAMLGKTFVGGPYTDRVTNLNIVVITVPCYHNDHVTGVIGAAIPLSELGKKIDTLKAESPEDVKLVSRLGNYLVTLHSNSIQINTNSQLNPKLQSVLQGASGTINYTEHNENQVLSYVPLQQAPWVVIVEQPLSQMQTLLEQTLVNNIFTVLIIFLFVSMSLYYLKLWRDSREAEKVQQAEKLALVGQLAAGMAHEIRNPLTTVKGFVQLIQSKDYQCPPLYLETILSELNRIELIVSEMMVLAKPSQAKLSPLNLPQLVNEIINLLEPQVMVKDIKLSVNAEPGLPEIVGEQNQLKQVFINLIKNAIESINNSGTVTVSMFSQTPKSVSITISDTGVGIPAKNLEKLGTPFFSTKDYGTGLGLMVSYRIIQNHNGEISVTSQPNQGTTFTITLPV